MSALERLGRQSFGRAPNGPWRVGDLCTCRPNRKQPSAKWFYPAVSTSEGEGAAPRSVGIYHRLNCVNRRYPIGVSIGAVAARPETDFWVNGARAGRGRERGNGVQIGREIVRFASMRREFSSSFFEISIDLDLGHGEGGVREFRKFVI